ncbi:MAG: hypothetical protein CL933_14310 [Deltaproteobacteria bacterium]|nr:hypothetical protein [Deltaproteobacteria bacterium]
MVFPHHRRPRDRGSETRDRGQFGAAEGIDAASGVAMLLRVTAFDDLSFEGKVFGERFFASGSFCYGIWRL